VIGEFSKGQDRSLLIVPKEERNGFAEGIPLKVPSGGVPNAVEELADGFPLIAGDDSYRHSSFAFLTHHDAPVLP
jgi:hypothetical protein